MLPGGAVRPAQEARGFGVAGDGAGSGIVRDGAADVHGDVGEDATGCGNMALFDVGHGAAPVGDGGEKVQHVQARGGGGVEFVVFLGEMYSNLFCKPGPGKKMVFCGIDNNPIKIKYTGFGFHHLLFTSSTSVTNRTSTAAINIETPPVTSAKILSPPKRLFTRNPSRLAAMIWGITMKKLKIPI